MTRSEEEHRYKLLDLTADIQLQYTCKCGLEFVFGSSVTYNDKQQDRNCPSCYADLRSMLIDVLKVRNAVIEAAEHHPSLRIRLIALDDAEDE
jgi:hypothetical protein